MSNSPASNVTLTALETEKREDPKTKTCTGRGTAKPLTEYSKGENGNLKEDGRWQYFLRITRNRLTRIHEPSTGEEAQFFVRCPGTTNRHRRGAGRSTYLVSDGQRFTSINYSPKLPTKIQTTAERGYLEEALICFRNKAFRAAVVMCWNLAFDHLCEFVLKEPAGSLILTRNCQNPLLKPT